MLRSSPLDRALSQRIAHSQLTRINNVIVQNSNQTMLRSSLFDRAFCSSIYSQLYLCFPLLFKCSSFRIQNDHGVCTYLWFGFVKIPFHHLSSCIQSTLFSQFLFSLFPLRGILLFKNQFSVYDNALYMAMSKINSLTRVNALFALDISKSQL